MRDGYGEGFEGASAYYGKGIPMLYISACCFIVSLIAAALGFSCLVPADYCDLSKMIFFVFLVAFVVTLVIGVFRRP